MPEKDTLNYSWFIERRNITLIIVLVFVILSAVTFTICYRHHAIYTEQTLKEDRSTANLLSLILEERLKKLVSVMESYVQRLLLLQAVRDKNVEKATLHMINLRKSNSDIDTVAISDRQGTLWAAYPARPEVMGRNSADRDWYKGVSKEWKSSISDVIQRIVGEKDLAVQISVPFFNEKGEAIGVLLNSQRTITLSDLIKQVPLDPGAGITVIDRKGQIVYSSEHEVKEIKPSPFQPGIEKAMAAKNKTFAVDDPDLGGRTRYISFAPVVNVGWTVFVGRDKRSIFLSESAYYIQVTAVAFFLFLSIFLFLVYSRKKMMAQHIMEQLQAERKIGISDQRYKSYIDVTMQIGWTTNDKGEIVEDNPSWSKYTGHSYEEIKGFGWMNDMHPDDRDHTEQIWEKAVAEKSFYETEYRIRRYDGVYRDYLARGIPLLAEEGSVREWIGTCIDITDRKLLEEELRENRKRLMDIVTFLPDATLAIDKEKRIIIWNKAIEEMTGVPAAEMIGKGNYAYTIPFYGDARPQLMDLVFLDQKEIAARYSNITREGDSLIAEVFCKALYNNEGAWVFAKASPLYDQSGSIIGAIESIRDITERKRAEEKLKTTLESLRNALSTTIQVMVSAVETRDPYTAGHQVRSADLARAIAAEMGLSQDKIDGIRMAGSIHDIGKLSIPAEILSKPTKLSAIELLLIKQHAQKGYEMLKDVESPWPLAEIVHQHHERMDGSGYPRNLKGEEILIEARILAVADVVEAMASHRPYRAGLGIDAALAEIENNKGALYDADAVNACLRLFREKGFKLEGIIF
ncbi:MAG: HD domain-containing phosphohydrolase [Deltaproteobacteria bacterium]